MWTKFDDCHSGGGLKEKYEYIFIEAASEPIAIEKFKHLFQRDPHHTTCTCCGPDYWIESADTLLELTGYMRGCKSIGELYLDEPAEPDPQAPEFHKYHEYQTPEQFAARSDVLIVSMSGQLTNQQETNHASVNSLA